MDSIGHGSEMTEKKAAVVSIGPMRELKGILIKRRVLMKDFNESPGPAEYTVYNTLPPIPIKQAHRLTGIYQLFKTIWFSSD